MTLLLLAPIIAPAAAAGLIAVVGWRPLTTGGLVLAAAIDLVCGLILGLRGQSHTQFGAGHLLRADALSVTMLIVVGAVGVLTSWASVGYIGTELEHGHTDSRGARRYGALFGAFLAAITLAVLANNLGIVWVAIEATTVATAFLVGHRRSRAALEATWKYVIICSTGISLAFLGTVLLYFASRHAGGGASALDFNVLLSNGENLDPAVTRMAAGLLLIGYGAKAGLVPFHTWLADAHSQAPAPVSALMSGVLLAVAFTALLRVKAVVDVAIGPGFLQVGLLTVGLLTLLVSASLLVIQRDLKRMLAYSSMENMALVAIAAAAGTRLAVAALLLHVLGHGVAKSVAFLSAGQLQATHDSTSIRDFTAVLPRSRLLGAAFATAVLVLLGFPPFAMFASELSIAHGLADAHLAWPLGVALVLMLVAFAAIAYKSSRILLGQAEPEAAGFALPASVRGALMTGSIACLALGVTAGPLAGLFRDAATVLGATG
ncbi:MAG: proton-conducting transporter membrane subunit [Actinomycetales bacterium]